ncbi:MAG: YARHG domain-containing protein [Flavobacteriaceae bacterium]|nr:YARHG domain-containing protein [Flavobacteriaceae bacterium]
MKKVFTIVIFLISATLLAQKELDYEFQNKMYSKSLSELKLLRNEFFARKGYKFKSKELNNYFNKFDWYEGTKSIDEIELSTVNKAKVDFIKKVESQKKLNRHRIRTLKLLSTLEGESMGFWNWSKDDRIKYITDCEKVGYLINDNSGMMQKLFIGDNHLFVRVIDGAWEFVVIQINDNKFFLLTHDITGDYNSFVSYIYDENKISRLDINIFPENWESNFKRKDKDCEFYESPFVFDFLIDNETILVESWEDECLLKKKLTFEFDKEKIQYQLKK